MAANDAWLIQGMNGAVPLASGQTFTGLSRGVFAFGGISANLTMVAPAGGTATLAATTTFEVYIPGPFTVVDVTIGPLLVYPESADYTIV